MPTAVNIVLADAAATPVSHTFVPLGPDPKGTFWFQDQSQPSAIGFWMISVRLQRPPLAQPGISSDDRINRVEIGLHEPVLANITNSTVTGVLPAPQIAYTIRGLTQYVMAERSALLDRQNIRKMNMNLQNDAQIIAVVEQLQMLR